MGKDAPMTGCGVGSSNWTSRLAFCLLLAILPLSCGGSDDYSTLNFGPAEILWKLQSFNLRDGTIDTVPDPDSYTLFYRRNGFVDIRADCNTCLGEYVLAAGLFRMAVNECTTTACPPGSLDRRFVAAIGSVMAFRMEGDVLALSYVNGTMIFRP